MEVGLFVGFFVLFLLVFLLLLFVCFCLFLNFYRELITISGLVCRKTSTGNCHGSNSPVAYRGPFGDSRRRPARPRQQHAYRTSPSVGLDQVTEKQNIFFKSTDMKSATGPGRFKTNCLTPESIYIYRSMAFSTAVSVSLPVLPRGWTLKGMCFD